MPTFEFTSPDGKTYEVDGPEGSTKEEAFGHLQTQLGSAGPQADAGNELARTGNALGQGITNAIGEGIGMLPDLAAAGLRKIGAPAPESPTFYSDAVKSGLHGIGMGVANLLGAKPAGGPAEAQNALESGAYGLGHGIGDAASMILPANAIAGAAKAGSLTQGVARAVASQPLLQIASTGTGEGVGQATGSPALGLATSLAIPAAGALRARSGALKAASAAIPSTEDLKATANAAYGQAKSADVVISKDSFANFADNLEKKIADEGISKRLHSEALGALGDIKDAADGNITLKGVDLLRQNINDVVMSPTAKPGERRLAGIMRDELDNYLSGIDSKDVIMGDAKAGTDALQTARQNWAMMKKSSTIDNLMQRAELSAPNYSASGKENAIRTEFRALAKNQNKMRSFSSDEQDAIRAVAQGGPVANALRFLGKLAPRGVVSGASDAFLGSFLGPAGPAIVMGAGEAGRRAATAATEGRVNNLSELIRSGGQSTKASAPSLLTDQSMQMIAKLLAQASNPNSPNNPLLLLPNQ